MRTPAADSSHAYDVVVVQTLLGDINRIVSCVVCDRKKECSNHWLGGVAKYETHVAFLVQALGKGCERADCPHPKEGVAT